MTTACKACAFYEAETANAAHAGLCRFNPPVFLTEEEQRGVWPVVKDDDWCGHFSDEPVKH